MYMTNLWPVDPADIVEQLQAEHDLTIAYKEQQQRKAELRALPRRLRYKANNCGLMRHQTAMQRAEALNAVPPWLTDEQRAQILAKYELAAAKQQATGIEYQVHHIVPLVGKCSYTGRQVVCGLHVPWNLKIVTKKRNLELGDRFDCDLPCGPGCQCGEAQRESDNGDFDISAPF